MMRRSGDMIPGFPPQINNIHQEPAKHNTNLQFSMLGIKFVAMIVLKRILGISGVVSS